MKSNTKLALMAGVTILSLSIPLTLSTAFAQSQKEGDKVVTPGQDPVEVAPQQGGPGFGGVQGGPPMAGPQGGMRGGGMPGQGMPPMMGGGMMGGGGGGTAMVTDGDFLFIVQGNRVFKLNKSDLKVVASSDLPRPQMPQGGGMNPPRGGGGAGAPPPASGK